MKIVAKFRSKNTLLATAAVEILEAERPMTLRQLYYRAVSAGHLANSKKEYQRLGSIMTRLRESGEVPRTWIVDHVRATLKPSSWTGLGDFGETIRRAYRKDYWARLDIHVEVFVEKDAIAGTIQPTTYEYDVPLRVCRGYSSISFAGEIAEEWAAIEKPIHAYYLGDHDPSGFDLERDLREKLQRYSGRRHRGGDSEATADNFIWQRLGVTGSDFDEWNLIELPVKLTDNRAKGFIDAHGTRCAEIDALPPTELRRRVEEAIVGHVDSDEWERLRLVEEAERETVQQFAAGFGCSDEN